MKLKSLPTVWLVDDDKIFRFVVKRLLEGSGKVGDMSEFDNGALFRAGYEQAMEAGDTLPKILFVDLFMPVMDGWGVLDSLMLDANSGKSVPLVYVMTSSIDKHDKDRVATYPFVIDVVQKPVTQDRLIEAVLHAAVAE